VKAAADAIDIVPDALALVEDVSAAIARRVGRIEISIAENGTGLRKVISTGAHSELYGGICQVAPRNPGTRLRKVVAGVYFSQSSATFSPMDKKTARSI